MLVDKLVKKFKVDNKRLIESEMQSILSLDHVTKHSMKMLESRIKEKI